MRHDELERRIADAERWLDALGEYMTAVHMTVLDYREELPAELLDRLATLPPPSMFGRRDGELLL